MEQTLSTPKNSARAEKTPSPQIEALQKQIKQIKHDEADRALHEFLKNSTLAKGLRIEAIRATDKMIKANNKSCLLNTINLAKLIGEAEAHFNSDEFTNELKIKGIKLSKGQYLSDILEMKKTWYYDLLNISKIPQHDIEGFFNSGNTLDYKELLKYSKNGGVNGNTDGDGDGDGKEKTKYTFVATLKTDKNISIRIDDKGNIKGDSADILRMIKFLQDSIQQ